MPKAEQLIQKDRLVDTFLTLVKIDSLSRQEAAVSDWLADAFRELGCAVSQDEIHNLVAVLPGNGDGDTVILCAHMDTVGTDLGIQPQIRDGRITSDGTTILGADDKSGVAVILEVMQALHDHPEIPRPAIEAVITVQEEVGLVGSRLLNKSSLRAKWGFVLDHGGPIGGIEISGPTSRALTFTVTGKASHAAVAPENGINAIQAAALGITKCPCGRVDPDVVIGIGVIHGGTATNIVPEQVVVNAMIRSGNPEKLERFTAKMEQAFADGCAAFGAKLDIQKSESYFAYTLDETSVPWQKAKQSAEALGFSFVTSASMGGTDCNNFNHAGIPTCAISTGQVDAHMKTESIGIQELYDCARQVITAVTL